MGVIPSSARENRSNHLSQAEIIRRASGPVRQYTPEEIAAMNQGKSPTEAAEAVAELLSQLTWEEQETAIRKSNSILLSRTLADITKGKTDPETIGNLAKASAIAKQWTVEKRQGGVPIDPAKMTVEEIDRKLANGD